jgi:hypothetical protein
MIYSGTPLNNRIYGVQNEQYFLAFISKVIEAVLALISKIYWKKHNAFNRNV